MPILAQDGAPLYALNPVKADLDDAGYTIQRIEEQFEIYLDSELLASNPGRLVFDLPDGTSLDAVRSRWSRIDDNHFSWYGLLSLPRDEDRALRTEGENSLDHSYVLLSSTEGRVMGTLQTPSGLHYHITPAAGGIHRLVRTQSSQHDGCGIEAVKRRVEPIVAAEKADACNVPSTQYRLDVLALYMPDFVGPQEQAARDSINMDIAAANTIFANSQVKITYNLVYAGPLTDAYPTSSGTLTASQALNWLWNLNNRQPSVEQLRNQYGADMVSLMIPPNPNVNCGIAMLPHRSGSRVVLQGTNTDFTDQTYIAYEKGCGFSDHTYAHEFGHNLGMQHDRGDSYASSTPILPYAYGYIFERRDSNNQIVHRGSTVMGCTSTGTVGGVCNRIPYFSNPDLSPSPYNVPIGEDTNAANGGSFNACVANSRASYYAGLRTSNSNAVPSVQITNPAANSSVRINTPITLAGSASDPENGNLSSSIQWSSDVQGNLGTGAQISVQLTTLGDHLLTAKVQDNGGKIAQHTIRVTVVESDPPRMFVDRPSHNQTVSGNLLVRGWATDASGVASITFKVNTTPVTLTGFTYGTHRADVCNVHGDLNDPNCPYVGWSGTLDTTSLPNGVRYLKVTATDAHGSSTLFNRRFIVSNTTTASFPTIADAYVAQAAPTRNYGTRSYLYARSTGSGQALSTYLKFSVSGITRSVQSAKLRIHTGGQYFPSSRLYWISSNSWNESTITWQNAPLSYYTQWATGSLPANAWVEIDVSSIVTGNGTYTLGFTASDTAGLWFYSRETQFVPSLEVTY